MNALSRHILTACTVFFSLCGFISTSYADIADPGGYRSYRRPRIPPILQQRLERPRVSAAMAGSGERNVIVLSVEGRGSFALEYTLTDMNSGREVCFGSITPRHANSAEVMKQITLHPLAAGETMALELSGTLTSEPVVDTPFGLKRGPGPDLVSPVRQHYIIIRHGNRYSLRVTPSRP